MNDTIVLISAVFASLASGVLVAYGACQAMFALFRIHARQVAIKSQAAVPASLPAAAPATQG